jgi:hypothetical protein
LDGIDFRAMAFALLFNSDGSGRSVVPMKNESPEELEIKHKGHFEARFETEEEAEAEKKRLNEIEGMGGGWK